MKHPAILASIALAAFLTACGGGGGGEPSQAPTAVSVAIPAPSVPPVASCTPEAVALQFFGDSTQVSLTPNSGPSPNSPWRIAGEMLAAKFGGVTSESRGVGHTTSNDLVMGTDHLNKPWPGSVAPGALTVVNFGINDSASISLDTYKANLRKLNPAYFETPNPTDAPSRPFERTQAFAQAMRDVAAELGTSVIDVNAYVLSLPNWQAYLVDGIHPSDELYALIARNAVYPAIEPAVARMRCQ